MQDKNCILCCVQVLLAPEPVHALIYIGKHMLSTVTHCKYRHCECTDVTQRYNPVRQFHIQILL